MQQELGPWTPETLGLLKADTERFFAAYYSELRRLVSAHETDSLPAWIRGIRLVHVHACQDGVLVAHIYPDKIPQGMSTQSDAHGNLFKFDIYAVTPVKDLYYQFLPPRAGGGRFPAPYPPNYEPGQPFGKNAILTPLEIVHPLDERAYTLEEAERLWTRLEYADMEEAVTRRRWRDASLAREEAELVLEIALERG